MLTRAAAIPETLPRFREHSPRMSFSIYVTGLMTGLSLIVAIGAQNAFVMRQGLRNEHVFAVCLACGLSDAVLIVLGVTSFGQIAVLLPWLDPAMRYGGAAFLTWYGARNLYSALQSSGALAAGEANSSSFSTDSGHVPRAHLAESACLPRHGRAARHDLDPISGPRGVVRRGRHDGLFPVFLFAWLRRDAGCGRSSRAHRPGVSWKRSSVSRCGRSPSNC